MTARLDIPESEIADFCRRWKVCEFSLFGSAAGGRMTPDSDVDILVSFAPGEEWSLLELGMMQDELSRLFAAEVDLVEKEAIRNPFRREHILRNRKVLYAA